VSSLFGVKRQDAFPLLETAQLRESFHRTRALTASEGLPRLANDSFAAIWVNYPIPNPMLIPDEAG
jgi:hypothetical protein